MAEYIERKLLDKELTDAAVNDKDKNRRTWAKAICVLHDLQAADVAPVVHGRWVDNSIPGSMLSACSVCGFPCGAYSFFYCPNCGARMDGDSDAKAD